MSRRVGLLIAAAALLPGACVTAPPPPPHGVAPFTTLAARFTDRALEQELKGDLHQALDAWKVVAALRPEAVETKRWVADLSARLKAAAERHYRDGLARLQEGNADAARRELLLALVDDPDHTAALEALKTRVEPDAVAYTVAAGESFEGIARKQYGDLAKAPIVARVNNLDPAGKPAAGTVLTLPNLPAPAVKPAVKRPPVANADAPEAPDSGYDTEPADLGGEGPPAAIPVERTAPVPPAAPAAPAATQKDVPAALDAAEARKREKAEELYNAGVRFFINQKLEEAIQRWEQTLALYPGHPKAAKDIETARGLQQKLKELR